VDNEWLGASSFERTHEVLAAINTLSIHTKLVAAGAPDPFYVAAAPAARDRLLNFVDELADLTEQAARTEQDALTGTDPRMGDLTQRFLAGRKGLPRKSALFRLSTRELRALIADENPTRREDLIGCLDALRSLLEQDAHADAVGLLGNR
jgi:hypothetical protein